MNKCNNVINHHHQENFKKWVKSFTGKKTSTVQPLPLFFHWWLSRKLWLQYQHTFSLLCLVDLFIVPYSFFILFDVHITAEKKSRVKCLTVSESRGKESLGSDIQQPSYQRSVIFNGRGKQEERHSDLTVSDERVSDQNWNVSILSKFRRRNHATANQERVVLASKPWLTKLPSSKVFAWNTHHGRSQWLDRWLSLQVWATCYKYFS